MDYILNPWPWYVSGPLIALVMALLLYFGKTFGMSSNLRTLCAMSGAGNYTNFFKFRWRRPTLEFNRCRWCYNWWVHSNTIFIQ